MPGSHSEDAEEKRIKDLSVFQIIYYMSVVSSHSVLSRTLSTSLSFQSFFLSLPVINGSFNWTSTKSYCLVLSKLRVINFREATTRFHVMMPGGHNEDA